MSVKYVSNFHLFVPKHKKHAGKQGVVNTISNTYIWFTVDGTSIGIMKKLFMFMDGSRNDSSTKYF